MRERKPNKKSRLAAAVLWTLVTVIWGAVFVRRFSDPGVDTMLRSLTVITLLSVLLVCISNWCVYCRFHKKETE